MKETSVSLTLLSYDCIPNKMKLKARNKYTVVPISSHLSNLSWFCCNFNFALFPLLLIFFTLTLNMTDFSFCHFSPEGIIPFIVTNYRWIATVTVFCTSEWFGKHIFSTPFYVKAVVFFLRGSIFLHV